MPLLPLVIYALIQGITEFVPVSSATHQVLLRWLVGWNQGDPGLDVAVHLGTLLAVALYFWRDVGGMVGALSRAPRLLAHHRPLEKEFWLLVRLLITTIPAIGVEYLIYIYRPDFLRSVAVLGWCTVGFGVLLYIVDKAFMTVRRVEHLSIPEAFLLGCLEASAFVPGVNRTGVTVTGARLLGMERLEAARFSFLMAIPALTGFILLQGYHAYRLGENPNFIEALMVGGLGLVFGLIALSFVMAVVKNGSFTIFVVYRLALGGLLLAFYYGWI